METLCKDERVFANFQMTMIIIQTNRKTFRLWLVLLDVLAVSLRHHERDGEDDPKVVDEMEKQDVFRPLCGRDEGAGER